MPPENTHENSPHQEEDNSSWETISNRSESSLLKIEESDDWESESDDGRSENDEGIKVPRLLPVSASLRRPGDSLCDTCKKLDLSPRRFIILPSDKERANKPNNPTIDLGHVDDLKRKPHCPLCRLILVALGSDVPSTEKGKPLTVAIKWDTDGSIPDINRPEHHIPKIRILKPSIQNADGQRIHRSGLNSEPEITMLANDSPTPYHTFFVRSIRDQIDFGMVRNWLSMCRTWHGSHCDRSELLSYQAHTSISEIPHFRLIDIVNNCVIPAPPDCTPYVTLSYLWGKIDVGTILVLLKDNVSELEKPGALSLTENYNRIPVTIRDAMSLVLELGFRFLWVDNLCIIQDDDGPGGSKQACISKMDLVYGGGHLTIIAATGTDANAGLPGVRPGTRGIAQSMEEILPGLRLGLRPKYQDYVKESQYFRRGWTFQEQEFTKRSLLFIGGQVIYRCMRTDQWREDIVVEHRDSKYGSIAHQDRNPDDIEQYEELIQTYSGLSLTKESDIYHAFAGMMGYFKADLKVNLCHGIPDAYFDWFLLWTSQAPQKRREKAPSWSWSGWHGESHQRIGQWYSSSIMMIRKALRQRTWIIWYQRKGHDVEECDRMWTPKKHTFSSSPRNFYGSHVQSNFSLDCSRTLPTRRTLADAPVYFEDTHNPSPGSGFLQFWTVSVRFKLDAPVNRDINNDPFNAYSSIGVFGKDDRQVGVVLVDPAWEESNVPKVHEFILLCEGRDEKAKDGRIDDEEGWKYKMMLIEWHGDWAERVSLSSIEREDLDQGLDQGPV
ncbi:heterokaryon incompatibility protein-domain-containing protein [Gymnopilus junonius]|uniref:Heterokaryon incompatibility protein-domain-containing protein n=1 Tax=Gymnopilus junonius TaxID=109634 RepID=A0A9P5NBI9_GYMJU|nr:heterokaryon incompatibility protein-domain-containing protein [Gymnopilus junonius]